MAVSGPYTVGWVFTAQRSGLRGEDDLLRTQCCQLLRIRCRKPRSDDALATSRLVRLSYHLTSSLNHRHRTRPQRAYAGHRFPLPPRVA